MHGHVQTLLQCQSQKWCSACRLLLSIPSTHLLVAFEEALMPVQVDHLVHGLQREPHGIQIIIIAVAIGGRRRQLLAMAVSLIMSCCRNMCRR